MHVERVIRQVTILVTLLTKLAGVFLALKSVSSPPVDPLVLAVCAFMMSGAQLTEGTILRALDKFMGDLTDPPDEEEPPKRKPPTKDG